MDRRLGSAVAVGLALVAGLALWPPSAGAAGGPVAAVARRAQEFLAALTPEQRALAARPLGDAERTRWAFVPGRYPGIELGALPPAQRQLAWQLLREWLSATGAAKVEAIVALETVLRDLEAAPGKDLSHRDPDRYALLVFGEPRADGPFALRFQGHHVSLHAAFADGRLVGHTPRFLGSNPHERPRGPQRGQRVLGAEEDLARALLLLLSPEQLRQAVIAADAPPDVLLGPAVAPEALGPRRGLPWAAMDDAQRAVLWRLLQEHAQVLRGEFAAQELQRIEREGLDQLSFAWAGSRERHQPHYYRLHGVHFAIEYDNTQNDANHVHVVWRDFAADFGGDALQRHLREQHGRR